MIRSFGCTSLELPEENLAYVTSVNMILFSFAVGVV